MDPNTPGYPMQQPGYPVVSQSPHQFPYYPNAFPASSFPQQKTPSQHPQQQHSLGAVPMQPGPGGAMMPSGFPQQSSGAPANFSAPFAQPPVPASMGQFMPPQPTSTSSLPPTTAPSFPQNMASVSTNNNIPGQPQPQRPVPHLNAAAQGPVPSAAQSPAAVALDKARVSVLLEINTALLQEVMNLQAAGKAGVPPQGSSQENNPSPTSDNAPDAPKGPVQKPGPEYLECMRRLQLNLGYLAAIADRAKKAGGVTPSAPGIMVAPPHMPSLNEPYQKLAELFSRTGAGAQAASGNGKPSPSPAAESVV